MVRRPGNSEKPPAPGTSHRRNYAFYILRPLCCVVGIHVHVCTRPVWYVVKSAELCSKSIGIRVGLYNSRCFRLMVRGLDVWMFYWESLLVGPITRVIYVSYIVKYGSYGIMAKINESTRHFDLSRNENFRFHFENFLRVLKKFWYMKTYPYDLFSNKLIRFNISKNIFKSIDYFSIFFTYLLFLLKLEKKKSFFK